MTAKWKVAILAGIAVLCRIRTATGRTIDELLGLRPLGPSIDDRIRTAVNDALERAITEGHPSLPATPPPPALPPAPRRRRES